MANNNPDQRSDPSEIMQELESFPYLNELITSILYRLRLSSAIQLEKGLKLDAQRQVIEQLEGRNGELEDQSNRLRTGVELLKEENQLLRETNQRIEQELLKKFQEKRAEVSQQRQEEGDVKSDVAREGEKGVRSLASSSKRGGESVSSEQIAEDSKY